MGVVVTYFKMAAFVLDKQGSGNEIFQSLPDSLHDETRKSGSLFSCLLVVKALSSSGGGLF